MMRVKLTGVHRLAVLVFLAVQTLASLGYGGSLTFVSYNVENLFDNAHDQGKNDWEFLPANYPGRAEACGKLPQGEERRCLEYDWTPDRLKVKVSNIQRVISSIDSNLPDLLLLTEIENREVVRLLAKTLGYNEKNFAMTESPDYRGIDVALVFKPSENLKFIRFREHNVNGGVINKPTRNILEVEFETQKKERLFVFGNHWPSQAAPSDARVRAAEVLAKRVKEILRLDANAKVLAAGDFNTVDKDDPHPFETVLFGRDPQGRKLFSDVHSLFMNDPKIPEDRKLSLKKGSYFYINDRQWNMLDHFFVTQGLLQERGVRLDVSGFDIFSRDFMMRRFIVNEDGQEGPNDEMIPKRYNFRASTAETAGYSDHLPIVLKLTTDSR